MMSSLPVTLYNQSRWILSKTDRAEERRTISKEEGTDARFMDVIGVDLKSSDHIDCPVTASSPEHQSPRPSSPVASLSKPR